MKSCLLQVSFFFGMQIGMVVLIIVCIVLFEARWTTALAAIGFVFGIVLVLAASYRTIKTPAVNTGKQPSKVNKATNSRINPRTV